MMMSISSSPIAPAYLLMPTATQVDFDAGTRACKTNAVWHLKELALSAFSSPRATLHASQEPHDALKRRASTPPRCSLAASASMRKTIPLSPEGRRRASASRERLEAASTRARSGRGALVGDRSAARRPLFSGTDTVTVAAVCSLHACCKHGRDAGTCSAPYDEQTRDPSKREYARTSSALMVWTRRSGLNWRSPECCFE